jgi:hypothetical protein
VTSTGDVGERPSGVVLDGEGARDIHADTISITQGGARDVVATTVTITQGGAARVRSDAFTVSQGGVAAARADRLTVESGAAAGAVVADEATIAAGANVLLLIARSVGGNVRPLLDWRAAAAFGLALGLALRLMRASR